VDAYPITLAVDTTNSTVSMIQLTATFPPGYTVTGISQLSYRYILEEKNNTSNSWKGTVSKVDIISGTNPIQAKLTFNPESGSSFPTGTDLILNIAGGVTVNGNIQVQIQSALLSNPDIDTFQIKAPDTYGLPTVQLNQTKALTYVSQMGNLPDNTVVGRSTDALKQNAIQPKNASKTTIAGGSFEGVIVPVGVKTTNNITQMFVILAWNPVTYTESFMYYVNRGDVQIYSGSATVLLDVIDAAADSQNSTTYTVQVQTTSDCTLKSCQSAPQTTSFKPVQYSPSMCASLSDGTKSTIDFMVPEGSGCNAIGTGDQLGAGYYYCAYLKNTDQTINSIQVPDQNNTKCLSFETVTNGIVTSPLPQSPGSLGYCTDACDNKDTYTALDSRTAVCGCGLTSALCNNEPDFPVLNLSDTDGITSNIDAATFNTNMQAMATFLLKYPTLPKPG
jgi:hypothetical protein